MQPYNALAQEETSAEASTPFAFTAGRTVGILLLVQLATALTLPFILSKPITFGSPAFLTAVAAHSAQIRSAALISVVGAGFTVYLGITAFPVFRVFSKPAALLFMVVCTVSCSLDLVHTATMLSMLSISNEYMASGTGNSDLYRVVGAAVAGARRSAHITQLLAISAWMFVFYSLLFRFKLVPRVLAGIGLGGVALQFTGVTLMMLLGYRSIGEMAMPLLPIHLTVAVWLLIKGFNDPLLRLPAVSNIRQN